MNRGQEALLSNWNDPLSACTASHNKRCHLVSILNIHISSYCKRHCLKLVSAFGYSVGTWFPQNLRIIWILPRKVQASDRLGTHNQSSPVCPTVMHLQSDKAPLTSKPNRSLCSDIQASRSLFRTYSVTYISVVHHFYNLT